MTGAVKVDTEASLEARNTAGNYFKEGYNCAEAIFLTFREILAPEIPVSAVKLMTGFGGGVGESGCMCGALTGSITALNMIKGRYNNNETREEAYKYANEFSRLFAEKYGATCCRALNPYVFESREHLTNCLKITGNTAKLLMDFIIQNKMYDPE